MENEIITLTLDPFGEKEQAKMNEIVNADVDTDKKVAELAAMTEANLTEEEKATVKAFAESIDITDTTAILQYGAGTQQKIAEFSDNALDTVKTQDLGETGELITSLIGELQGFNNEIDHNNRGLLKIFRKAKTKAVVLKAKYDKCAVSVNNIVNVLDGHQVTLLKDVAVLDTLYEKNLSNFKELSMYIVAGKQKLEAERNTTLVELKKRAEESGLPEDAQRANDFASMCDRFEKKIYDLELTRMVSIQTAPQIRLVQNNDTQMSEKIQSTVVNTIPLWKSQMIIALGLAHSEEALKAESAVNDMTNELLKKNAEKLHQSTVAIAKEAERGVIDIETLAQTNRELIATLDEVQEIQADGKAKRREAEAELGRIEGEIKDKLLEIKQA
ncbi:MAG: toxic anion resistance protein [Firmicutes bacterium]|nr:toxic anion resistance protein [Candidatus Colimorpha enterica]